MEKTFDDLMARNYKNVSTGLAESIRSMSKLAEVLDKIRPDKAEQVRGAARMMAEWKEESEKEAGQFLKKN